MPRRRLLYGGRVPATDDGAALDRFLPPLRVLLPDDDGVSWLRRRAGRLPSAHHYTPVTPYEGVPGEPLGTGADGPVVSHLAVSVLSTGSDTRVPAVEVEAGEAGGALVVVLAVPALAEGVGVSAESRRAAAHGLPALGQAVGSGPAGVRVARVRLRLAPGYGVRHRDVALNTLADRVAETVNLAPGVLSAGARITWIRRSCPYFDPCTTGDGVGLGGVTIETCTDRVTLEVYVALGVGSAGCGLARIRSGHTVVVGADVVSGAVPVHLTLPPAPGDGVRHGHVGGQAAADRIPGRGGGALGVGPAGGRVAGVGLLDTSLGLANISRLTVRIPHTLRTAARDGVWFWDQTGFASANRVSTKVYRTHGSGPARGRVARIRFLHAPLVLTDEPGLAVRVPDTLGLAAGDSIRVGDKSGFASTDGISGSGDGALSSRSARRRIAWVRFLHTPLALADETKLAVRVADTLGLTTYHQE